MNPPFNDSDWGAEKFEVIKDGLWHAAEGMRIMLGYSMFYGT